MITSQIIVSLATNTVENVTEWDHMEQVPCPEQQIHPFYGCLVLHQKGVGPKKKERVTTVKEVSTLTFDWGSKREVVSERTVSETREAFSLEWNRAELKKPELQSGLNISGSIFVTNAAWTRGWITNAQALDVIGPVFTNHNTLELHGTSTNVLRLNPGPSITNRYRTDLSFTPANPDCSEGPLALLFSE